MKDFLKIFPFRKFSVFLTIVGSFTYNILLNEDVTCNCKNKTNDCLCYLFLPWLVIFFLMLWTDKTFQRAWSYTWSCKCSSCCSGNAKQEEKTRELSTPSSTAEAKPTEKTKQKGKTTKKKKCKRSSCCSGNAKQEEKTTSRENTRELTTLSSTAEAAEAKPMISTEQNKIIINGNTTKKTTKCKRCVFWGVLLSSGFKALLIGLLWVVSLFINGDWYVCWSGDLACKHQTNLTAEEKTNITALKNESRFIGFGLLLSILILTALLSSCDWLRCSGDRKVAYYQLILKERENIMQDVLKDAVTDELKGIFIDKINDKKLEECFNYAEEIIINSEKPTLSREQEKLRNERKGEKMVGNNQEINNQERNNQERRPHCKLSNKP